MDTKQVTENPVQAQAEPPTQVPQLIVMEGLCVLHGGKPQRVRKVFAQGGRARLEFYSDVSCWADEVAPDTRVFKHDPLPWMWSKPATSNGFVNIKDARGNDTATCYSESSEANAGLIVAAVNNHDRFLEAITEAQAVLARYIAPGDITSRDAFDLLLGILDGQDLVKAVRAARGAA